MEDLLIKIMLFLLDHVATHAAGEKASHAANLKDEFLAEIAAQKQFEQDWKSKEASLEQASPYSTCDHTRADCETRGMFTREDHSGFPEHTGLGGGGASLSVSGAMTGGPSFPLSGATNAFPSDSDK